MKPAQKYFLPLVFLLIGLLLVVTVLVSWTLYDWERTPAGLLGLIAAALFGVGALVKGAVDIVNGLLDLRSKVRRASEEPPEPFRRPTPYSQFLYESYCAAPGRPALSRTDFELYLWDYLDWVQRDCNQARLYTERTPPGEQVPQRKLEEVFIPLTLRLSRPPDPKEVKSHLEEEDGVSLDEHRAYLRLMERRRREGEIVPLEKLLTLRNRLAVIGGAGCGKSTLTAYLAYGLAEAAQSGRKPPFELPGGAPCLIPFRVPLRSFRYYQRQYGVRGLHEYILKYINQRSIRLHLPEDFLERLLRAGHCLLMLDGLDEVVRADERGMVREQIEQLARAVYPQAFFIVTAREAGYQENAIFGDDFARLDVQDLEPEQIEALVRNWCRKLPSLEDSADEVITAIGEVNQRYTEQDLPPLLATPLLITLVVSARWAENTQLPRDRARLYELVVKAVLSAQYTELDPGREEVVGYGGPWESQRQWLSRLAWEMHQGGQAGAAVPESRLREILGEKLAAEELEQFIEAVRYRGGLLEERDELFQFIHLSFQEFLAARYLFHQKDRRWVKVCAGG